jgi:hypothetical protein
MSSKKYKLAALATSICWLGFQGSVVFAADLETENKQIVNNLTRRTYCLENQIRSLQNQVSSLKHRQKTQDSQQPLSESNVEVVTDPNHPILIIGTPVVSSPYIGINSEYSASDLVVNQPYVNEDLYLLLQRKQLWNYLHLQHCYPIPNTPIVNLSGKIVAQITHGNEFDTFHNGMVTNIDLTGVELDTEILVNKWLTGLIAFVYDNSPPNASLRRIDNSNVFLDRGFLTVGNLAEFPLYATIGQFYVPFGQYSSAMISDPFTKILGRTKARAITFGFAKAFDSENNLNLAAFVFRGPTRTSLDNRGLHNFGGNIDYTFTEPSWKLDLAGSYIRSIADAAGMQHNGNFGSDAFSGFASNTMTEILNPVSGLDARGTLGIKQFSLKTEYVTAATNFSQTALSFGTQNSLHGAKPSAFNAEAAYKFNILDKPSSFAVGFTQSKEALALLIPKKRYSATLSTSIWKDTIESLEFRHDIDYSATDVATGGQGFQPIVGTGNHVNAVTFQVGLYF